MVSILRPVPNYGQYVTATATTTTLIAVVTIDTIITSITNTAANRTTTTTTTTTTTNITNVNTSQTSSSLLASTATTKTTAAATATRTGLFFAKLWKYILPREICKTDMFFRNYQQLTKTNCVILQIYLIFDILLSSS